MHAVTQHLIVASVFLADYGIAGVASNRKHSRYQSMESKYDTDTATETHAMNKAPLYGLRRKRSSAVDYKIDMMCDANGYTRELRDLVEFLQTPRGVQMYKAAYRQNMTHKIERYSTCTARQTKM